jgi:phage host-nuclease inhibitor protein Gam
MSPKAQVRKSQVNVYPIPQTLQQVGTLQNQMTNLLLKRTELINQFAAQRAAIDEAERQAMVPVEQDILALADAIHLFAKKNKKKLIGKEEKKTIDTGSGTIQWYMTALNAWIKDAEEFIRRAKARGHLRLVRTTEEPNKAALIEEYKENPNIVTEMGDCSVKQHERFAIVLPGAEYRLNRTKNGWKLAKIEK